MDWPEIDNVLRIKPVTNEKSQRKIWTIYRKKKKTKPKTEEKKEKNNKKEGIINIYV